MCGALTVHLPAWSEVVLILICCRVITWRRQVINGLHMHSVLNTRHAPPLQTINQNTVDIILLASVSGCSGGSYTPNLTLGDTVSMCTTHAH